MRNKEIIFESKDLCKSFLMTKAVDNVSIKIFKGEVRGLIGENGSGKSTLASMMAGILKPNKGEMFFYGKSYDPKDQVDAAKSGISMMVQEMNTIEGLKISENIFLGKENEFVKNGIVNRKNMNDKAKKVLVEFNLPEIQPDINIELISFENRKLIELAKSLYSKPKLFIIDEATTSLSRKGRDLLFEMIKKLKKQGTSILFITHNLEELMKICDTITVLRDGKLIDTVENNDLNEDLLKNMMVGREIKGDYYRKDYDTCISTNPVLEIKNITIPNVLKNISFNLNEGEILGIGGLAESGMHTLGKVIFGAKKAESGYIKDIKSGKQIKKINDAISNGIGYTSKNRDQEGIILLASIKDNIALPSLEKFGKLSFVNPKREKDFCLEATKKLKVKMNSIEQLVLYLSGGNKQKVVLSKWISRNCNVLILDSPTRGIDVMIKASIYNLMQKLVQNKKSIIMISEEILELIGMCDRVIILKDGEISKEFKRSKDLTEEKLVKHMI